MMLTYKQLTVRVVPPEQRVGSVSLELCVLFLRSVLWEDVG